MEDEYRMEEQHFIVRGKYAFFYGGCFSQWYPSKFLDTEDIQYNYAEQAMMYKKAELFNDTIMMKKILATDSPKEQKSLGRKIKNFNQSKWTSIARKIVFMNNFFKFSQNKKMLKILLSTEDLTIVEASPYDIIWGIGRSIDYPYLEDKSKWKGTNWLGKVLVDVRDTLRYV